MPELVLSPIPLKCFLSILYCASFHSERSLDLTLIARDLWETHFDIAIIVPVATWYINLSPRVKHAKLS